MNKVKLSDLRNGNISWQTLSETLEQSVSTKLLVSGSDYEIVRECIMHINFRKMEADVDIIRKQAIEILKLTPFRQVTVDVNQVFINFINIFLGYKGAPMLYKKVIENEIKKDFAKLNELVKYYRTKEFIKKYEAEDSVPRNHEDRTLLVFYKRALGKREQVIQFLYNEVDTLSLSAAKRSSYTDFILEDEVMSIIHSNTYYSYRESFFNSQQIHGIDYELLDHRLINPFRNKLSITIIAGKIDAGYTHNELNSIILKLNPSSHIDYILNVTDLLPGIHKRKEVFEEIKYLFSKKKWYALYALALPQIEGVFADIISIASPGKTVGGTLTDKVDSVRTFFDLDRKFFDYYQYYLPTQRNRFAHAGYDVDIIPKAYHCIFDLWFLLNTFYNLSIPLLEIIRIMNQGKSYFEHIGKLSKFICLIKEVSQAKGFVDKESNVKTFFNNLFCSLIDLDEFLKFLQIDFDKAFSTFSQKFSDMVYSCTNEYLSFASMSKGEIVGRMESIKITFDKGIFPLEDEIKLLVDTNYFIRNIRLIFKSDTLSISSKTDIFYKENKETLDKIESISFKQMVDFKVSNYFMFVDDNKWEHIKFLL